ncbi:hypothetical protein TWF106_005548 [Orbilia oligospora]|uniref:Uncharacterized protein n=1 Tax=Orbilia oligospora TaxID=2813651 RepID=A0A6G1M282_ORBOL|nr:hypothetical protein TWF788_005272 [Orbilia oligospora]KAF3195522.1 hypothetical protein TWF106_005548 [Orbilia oligospora]KAF3201337.1 hypothetical protein TWF679_011397 [Orbilia oligospora]KAF3212370.1 hypothetical protein TWF191_010524 [Orbilia oligospora]KAF3242834.1 hypothetical protein TWF192_008549 [Orbilia oligospora]
MRIRRNDPLKFDRDNVPRELQQAPGEMVSSSNKLESFNSSGSNAIEFVLLEVQLFALCSRLVISMRHNPMQPTTWSRDPKIRALNAFSQLESSIETVEKETP